MLCGLILLCCACVDSWRCLQVLAIVVAKLPSCEAVQLQRVSRCAALCPSCSVCTSFLCVQSLTRLTVACATPGVWVTFL